MEDVLSANETDAQLAHFGLLPLNRLPKLPWVRSDPANPPTASVESRIWTTRRMNISRVTISFMLTDFQPTVDLVFAIRVALRHNQDWQKAKALREVFATW